MPPLPTAPTSEQGRIIPGGIAPWALFTGDTLEKVPELQWPISVQTYALMRNDAQLEGLLYGTTLPIRRYQWYIRANDARPDVVERLAADLNLPVEGQEDAPERRRKRRFSWDTHLSHALLSLHYGHYYFEQVGEIEDGWWRLRKLAPRPPDTISEIQVSDDGGLKFIKQNVGMAPPEISVDRLMAYVWGKEGANWVGRSMFRSCYRNWLIKDRLLRVDAIKHERNGVGMPIMKAPPGASAAQMKELDAMAQSYKAGEAGGGAIPHNSELTMEGVRGTIPDTVGSIRFHNEEMAKAFLEMFMNLGQTETGSRALGETFVDYTAMVQETIAIWIRDNFNEHMIEDWVDWNVGEDAQAPLLAFRRDEEANTSPEEDAADALVEQIDSGNVQVSPDVEAAIRVRASRRPSAQGSLQPRRQRRNAAGGEDSQSIPLPPRPLRRQPYAHEIRASVDFADMDASWTGARDGLVAQVQTLQRAQVDELHDAIVAAGGDVKKLANLSAAPVAQDVISDAMVKSVGHGAALARGEAERQGVKVTQPSLTGAEASARARAEAVDQVLARSLSESAARKAIQLSGGGLDASAVADTVRSYLAGLSNSYLSDQLGDALTAAQNSGRREVFKRNDPTTIYASELLDGNTCEECVAVDGTEYSTLDEAESAYPAGGYSDCLGGPRCRGTLVAVYDEEGPE